PASPELGERVTLTAQVADANGASCGTGSAAPYSYAWTLSPAPGSSAVLASSGSGAAFVPDVLGSYGYTVTVTDSLGFQGSASGTITVTRDCTATVNIAQSSANPIQTFTSVQLLGSVT